PNFDCCELNLADHGVERKQLGVPRQPVATLDFADDPNATIQRHDQVESFAATGLVFPLNQFRREPEFMSQVRIDALDRLAFVHLACIPSICSTPTADSKQPNAYS